MRPARTLKIATACRRTLAKLVWQLLLGPLRSARQKRKFKADFNQFHALAISAIGALPVSWEERAPYFFDATASTGFDRHYVYHTAWAMRRVVKAAPDRHVDISSSLYFVALLSAIMPVEFYDFRPADLHLTNLRCKAADLMRLPFADSAVSSLSCMHVIEHVGLGRYGDPLDPTGDALAAKELSRVLKPGGALLIVVPVGRRRVCFNAHRIYGYADVLELFADLELTEFSLIPDHGSLEEFADGARVRFQDYGCGCFVFKKALLK